MKFCNSCGRVIDDNSNICSECNVKMKNNEELVVVSNLPQKNISKNISNVDNNKTKNTSQKKVILSLIKYRKVCLAILLLCSIVFFILGVTTFTSEDYKYYSKNYAEYIENYKENLNTSNTYGGTGLLGSGYNQVAEGWKNMADTASSKLWEFRVKAIIFISISIAFLVLTFITKKVTRMKN